LIIYTLVALAATAMPITQTSVDVPVTASTNPATQVAVPQTAVLLPRDTPVELMAPSEISTASATVGTVFKLRVNKAIFVDGRLVIPVGTLAFGKVLAAVDSGGLGRNGQMSAKLMHLQLGDVEISLDGETSAKGQGAGSAGVAFLFGGVLGLFHRGNNAKIKAGEIISGYVGQDTLLNLTGPKPRLASQLPAATMTP
jgi:hypothetical protein